MLVGLISYNFENKTFKSKKSRLTRVLVAVGKSLYISGIYIYIYQEDLKRYLLGCQKTPQS